MHFLDLILFSAKIDFKQVKTEVNMQLSSIKFTLKSCEKTDRFYDGQI